jgi:hypothetical protein
MNLTLREILDRYGPLIAVAVVLTLLVVMMPGGGGDQQRVDAGDLASGGGRSGGEQTASDVAGGGESGSFASGGGGGGSTSSVGGSSGGGGGGTTAGGSGGGAAGTATGNPAPPADTTCRGDGAMPAFSNYAPPCIPVFTGDNGGSTYMGVTGDKVKVVYYFPFSSAATQATLRAIGADDPRSQSMDVAKTLARYFNIHYETYKRQVELVFFESDIASDDDAGLKANAVKIATDIKPFAVIGAESIVATELAARGILCLCTVSEPSGYYQQNAPYTFGILPEAEEYFQQMAEYIGKRLAGKPAKWAGDLPVGMKTTERKFGLIYIEGVESRINPRSKEAVAFYEQELAKYGVRLTKKVAYVYDAARSQEQSTNIIAQMASAGVSNLACACDPLYPIFLTKAATQQQYYPEWFITGTALIDTTFFGRTYDPAQWAHAFGISPLYVFWADISQSTGYKEFHHMRPDAEPGDEGTQINVREPAFSLLFGGMHYAGPNLTPENFAKGLWNAPARGGSPTVVLVKFTPESYTAIKDFTEVFWHPTTRAKDETGKDGVGVLLKVDGGRRFPAGAWPKADPNVFTTEGTIFAASEGLNWPHDEDGHTHAPEERCRSCS